MKKKLLIILLLLLLVGGGVVAYVYSVNNAPEEGPLTAEQLLENIFPKEQYSEFEVKTRISFNKELLAQAEAGDALTDAIAGAVYDDTRLTIDESIVGKTDGTTFYTEGESVSVLGLEKNQKYVVSWLKREEDTSHIYVKSNGQWAHIANKDVTPFFTTDVIKDITLSESDAVYTVTGQVTGSDALSFYGVGISELSALFDNKMVGSLLSSSEISFCATFDKENLTPKELFFTLETPDEYINEFDISVFFLTFDDKTTLSMPQSIADEAIDFDMNATSVLPEQKPEETLEVSLNIEDYRTCVKMSDIPSGNWSHMEFSFDDVYHKLGEPVFLYLSDTWTWDKEKNSFDEYYFIPAKAEFNIYISHENFSSAMLTIKNPSNEPLEARNCAVIGFRLENTDKVPRPKFVVANNVTWGDGAEKIVDALGTPFTKSAEGNGQTYLDYLSGDLSLLITVNEKSGVTDIILRAE